MVDSRGLEIRICNGGGGTAAETGSRKTKQEVGSLETLKACPQRCAARLHPLKVYSTMMYFLQQCCNS